MGRTRWAVAAFVVASLLWFPSSILAFQPGKVRWPIKTSIPEGADPDHPTRVDLADLIDATKLPDAPGVTKNDAQFQAARIPKFDNPLGIAEGDILSTVGWLHLVAAEADGDYHIQISPTHDDDQGTDFLIVEVPTPETRFVADASLHAPLEAVRSLIRERMLQGREPSTRGSVLTHPACVEVAGQLFYDDAHVGDQPRGKRGMKAATLWELHPVTHIAFSRGCAQ